MWHLPRLCSWLCGHPLCSENKATRKVRVISNTRDEEQCCGCDLPFQSLLPEPVPFGQGLHDDLLLIDRVLLGNLDLRKASKDIVLWVVKCFLPRIFYACRNHSVSVAFLQIFAIQKMKFYITLTLFCHWLLADDLLYKKQKSVWQYEVMAIFLC